MFCDGTSRIPPTIVTRPPLGSAMVIQRLRAACPLSVVSLTFLLVDVGLEVLGRVDKDEMTLAKMTTTTSPTTATIGTAITATIIATVQRLCAFPPLAGGFGATIPAAVEKSCFVPQCRQNIESESIALPHSEQNPATSVNSWLIT